MTVALVAAVVAVQDLSARVAESEAEVRTVPERVLSHTNRESSLRCCLRKRWHCSKGGYRTTLKGSPPDTAHTGRDRRKSTAAGSAMEAFAKVLTAMAEQHDKPAAVGKTGGFAFRLTESVALAVELQR